MAMFESTFSEAAYQLKLYIDVLSQDYSANTSTIGFQLKIRKGTTVRNPYSTSGNNYNVTVHGVAFNGSFTFDFSAGVPVGTEHEIASNLVTVTHDADGTKSIAVGASASTSPGTLGSASFIQGWALPTIPRASNASLSANPVDAGTSVTINTNRASGSFTHTIQYAFGSQSGTIATDVADSVAWTPPLSLLNEIPNSASGGATITTYTYNGGTHIGTTTTSLTIVAPSHIVPSIASVTYSEATTSPNVASIVGAFVQNMSRLSASINGAAGVYGSTISSYKIELFSGGAVVQTINAATGTTAAISQSGSLTLRGTVTDSRGRTATRDYTVSVLPYAPPAINTFTAQRASGAGTPAVNGTSIRVDLEAQVSSLMNGTQRNQLKYRLRTKLRNDTTAWSSVTPVASANTGSVAYPLDDIIVSTYPVTNSYLVRIEIEDNLGTVSALEATVSTGGVQVHFSRDFDGIGVGKFWESYGLTGQNRPSIDSATPIYQRNGKRVLDVDDFAARIPPVVADVAALPTASNFIEGTRIHVDALNVDFLQLDGVWVQDGIAVLPDLASRDAEYAKAGGAYRATGARVRITSLHMTYEYYSSGVAVPGWFPVGGILPALQRRRSSDQGGRGSDMLYVHFDADGSISHNIFAGTNGTLEIAPSGWQFIIRQRGKWRIHSRVTASNMNSWHNQILKVGGGVVRGSGAYASGNAYTTNTLLTDHVFAAGDTFWIDAAAGAAWTLIANTDGGMSTFIEISYIGPG